MKSYKHIKTIAEGGQSSVYLCEYYGNKVVLKCYHCDSNDELSMEMEEVIHLMIFTVSVQVIKQVET
jgi:predicted Ser/Thr protein kinase